MQIAFAFEAALITENGNYICQLIKFCDSISIQSASSEDHYHNCHCFILVKVTARYLTNSVAILTDALESIVNVAAGFIGVYSLFISAKPKDEDHPYGHGKAEFISAAVEGTLIIVAGILIIYKAIVSLIAPHVIQKLDYGIILVAATALINFIAGTICLNAGRKIILLL